jgi:hypothetical protein
MWVLVRINFFSTRAAKVSQKLILTRTPLQLFFNIVFNKVIQNLLQTTFKFIVPVIL